MPKPSKATASLSPSPDAPSIQIQSVLYNLPAANVARAVDYINTAASAALASGVVGAIDVSYGDCSPSPALTADRLSEFREQNSFVRSVLYTFFDANLGSAEGHNRLIRSAQADLILVLNPDILLPPNALIEMVKSLQRPQIGAVEARQIPIEHPKDFDKNTGETSWASTACLLFSAELSRKIGCFDSKSFFLYCDDVDFSWRIRLSGHKVVYQPNVSVFHDKRLSDTGGWMSGAAERYYSAEAALFLMYKYSREDLLADTLAYFKNSGNDDLLRAFKTFEERQQSGDLPEQLDPDHTVAQFVNGAYAAHRFAAT